MVVKLFYNLKPFPETRYSQYMAVIIAALGTTTVLSYVSWPSPSLPILLSEDSPLGKPISPNEASWIVSSLLLAGLPAAMTYHKIFAKFGRKQSLQVYSIILFLCWFFIIFGNHVIYIYIARCVGGSLLGVVLSTAAMYTAEVSDADIRGKLGTFFGIMKILGSIIVLSVGPFVSYKTMAIVCACIPLTMFLLLFLIPESPYFLVKKNKMEEARESVAFLSGTDKTDLIEEKIKAISLYVHSSEDSVSVFELISNPIYCKVLIVLLVFEVFEYFGGFYVLAAYQQVIIGSSGSIISPELSSIIFGLIQIPAALISAFLVDKLGRKVIIYIGSIGCAIPLFAEGVYFYLEEIGEDVSNISWIPTSGIVIFLIMHALYYSMPYILLGELFTDKIQNVATMFFLSVGVIAVFGATKSFEPIVQGWGLHIAFWIYAFFSFVTSVFTFFFIPETKGKTFKEIEQMIYK